MTGLHRLALAGAVLLLLVSPALASDRQQTRITISYHEMVPAGSDSTPVFTAIFARMRHDCELVGRAFSRKCVITNININVNPGYGNMAGTRNLNANATIMLEPGPVEMPSTTAPTTTAPSTKAPPPPTR